MIAQKNPSSDTFIVIHPLDDAPEVKRTGEHLGEMEMTRGVRTLLLVLRGYLILMIALLGYHILDLAGVFSRHLHR